MTTHRLTTRSAVAMIKKLNILSPSTSDVSLFIEYYASTKGDIDACANLLIRSKLESQSQKIALQTHHAEQMEALQARLDLSIEQGKKTTNHHMKQTSDFIILTDKLAEAFKKTQAILLESQQGIKKQKIQKKIKKVTATKTDEEVATADINNADKTPNMGTDAFTLREKVVTLDAADEQSKKDVAQTPPAAADSSNDHEDNVAKKVIDARAHDTAEQEMGAAMAIQSNNDILKEIDADVPLSPVWHSMPSPPGENVTQTPNMPAQPAPKARPETPSENNPPKNPCRSVSRNRSRSPSERSVPKKASRSRSRSPRRGYSS